MIPTMGLPTIRLAESVIEMFEEKAKIPAREVSKRTGSCRAIRVANITRHGGLSVFTLDGLYIKGYAENSE